MTATVVVIGSVNMDLVIRMPRLPRPGETVIGGTFTRNHGGKGANKAVAASTLGASTFLIAAVGDDSFGREARAALVESGVDVSRVTVGTDPTGVAGIMVDDRGENLIAVASGANFGLHAQQVTEALDGLLQPGTVIVADLEVPEDAVLAAAQAAREAGCVFVLNPAPAHPLPAKLLSLCSVLAPNEHEAGSLGWSSVDSLLARGAGAVIVTRGAQGADLFRPGEPVFHQTAFPISVVDTTGAGDAFTATLAWAISEGYPLENSVRLAAAGGALATTRLGARSGLASRPEVESLAATAAPEGTGILPRDG